MKRSRKILATLALGALGAAGWIIGNNFVQNVQFARAVEQVDATRQELQKVEDIATVFRKVGKAIEPSVVSIEVTKTVQSQPMSQIPDDFLRRFFPDRDGDGQPDMPDEGGNSIQKGEGSGVIVSADNGEAYIVTNNHVAGGASEMTIMLSDGREIHDATLVGTDPKSDVAVVKIKADHLIPAQWGNSDDLAKGDFVLAFGSPFGYVGSMTHGIVSALNRNNVGILGQMGYENFIQVDCPINPGNSGGPLVNLKGEVIGINTAIATRTGSFAGIGLAIPSNQAKSVYQQLRDKGKVIRGWLGVAITDVSKAKDLATAAGYTGDKGILVKEVNHDTPADGKLESGDVIMSINGKALSDSTDLRNTIAMTSPGTELTLGIVRNNKPQDVRITIAQQPDGLTGVAQNNRGARNGNGASAANIGVRLATPTSDDAKRLDLRTTQGALVTEVEQGSIAMQQGLEVGDLITRVGDTPVTNAQEAADALAKQDLKKGVVLHVTDKTNTKLLLIKTER